MKIKLAILERDSVYLQKIVAVFNNKYGNELEIYYFTELQTALVCLSQKRIDVFLANYTFEIDFLKIPEKIGFAYLVDTMYINRINDKRAICKYQKIDLLYKQILNTYSEQNPNIVGVQNTFGGKVKTIAFSSPCGGVGTSVAAVGCAINLSSKGFRVLYLNFETFGSADIYFTCDDQFDFSEVAYALKSNETNRAIKLQSSVKQDATGVYFYSSDSIFPDIMEMKYEDYITLQNEIQMLGCYDYIILDIPFPSSRIGFMFLQNCNMIVSVSDGSQESEIKIERALQTIQIVDNQLEYAIQSKMFLIYNKSFNDSGLPSHEIRTIGSFPRFESVSPMQLSRQFALSKIYDNLLI